MLERCALVCSIQSACCPPASNSAAGPSLLAAAMGLLGQGPRCTTIRGRGQLRQAVHSHSHRVHETLPLLLVRLLIVPCLPGLLLLLDTGLLHRLQGRWGRCSLRLHGCRAAGDQRAARHILQAGLLTMQADCKLASAPRLAQVSPRLTQLGSSAAGAAGMPSAGNLRPVARHCSEYASAF